MNSARHYRTTQGQVVCCGQHLATLYATFSDCWSRTLVDTNNSPLAIDLEPGKPTVFVGANGSGKTRLAVEIDRVFTPNSIPTHRISAHRALRLNPNVDMQSLEGARNFLWYGANQPDSPPAYKFGNRWRNEPATSLLDDFDQLLQALFAEESQKSSEYRQQALKDPTTRPPTTSLDRLKAVWEQLLPHVRLSLSIGAVRAASTGSASLYRGNVLSDGERSVFYLLGQALAAPQGQCPVVGKSFSEREKNLFAGLLSRDFLSSRA